MRRLTFFCNTRFDGGVRTGVAAGEVGYEGERETVLHRFDAGPDFGNPGLRWYVDVEFVGEDLPQSAHSARDWLLKHETEIRGVLSKTAEEIGRTGIDTEPFPLIRTFHPSDAASGLLRLGAARVVDGREAAGLLLALGDELPEIIRKLETRSGLQVA